MSDLVPDHAPTLLSDELEEMLEHMLAAPRELVRCARSEPYARVAAARSAEKLRRMDAAEALEFVRRWAAGLEELAR